MSESEIGEIRGELKEYKKQLDSLKEDLEIVVRFSSLDLIGQIAQYASGVPGVDPAIKEKCERFIERHRFLIS
jgi:hypothetical protein